VCTKTLFTQDEKVRDRIWKWTFTEAGGARGPKGSKTLSHR